MAVGMPKSTNILITSTKKKGPLANENLNNNNSTDMGGGRISYESKGLYTYILVSSKVIWDVT